MRGIDREDVIGVGGRSAANGGRDGCHAEGRSKCDGPSGDGEIRRAGPNAVVIEIFQPARDVAIRVEGESSNGCEWGRNGTSEIETAQQVGRARRACEIERERFSINIGLCDAALQVERSARASKGVELGD